MAPSRNISDTVDLDYINGLDLSVEDADQVLHDQVSKRTPTATPTTTTTTTTTRTTMYGGKQHALSVGS